MNERVSPHGALLPPIRSSHAVSLPLEDIPHALAPYGLGAPASWFHRTTSRYSLHGTPVRYPDTGSPSSGFSPASEYAPARCRTAWRCQLSRGLLPPQRYQSAKSHQSRDCLTRVMLRPHAYHASRRVAPSAVSLVSFQPGALTGFRPSELDLTEIAGASRLQLPLMRFAKPETVPHGL
jgi:hypothetical protein